MYYKGINLTNLSNTDIYDLVLERKIPIFPPGFWCSISKEDGIKIALELLKHLIETRLKVDKDWLVENLSKELILNNKLWTPCKLYFGKSAVKYLMKAYPNEYRAFEFIKSRIPQGYWCERDNRVEAIRWLIEERLLWSLDEIKEKFNRKILAENGLGTLVTYYTSSWDVINEIYPDMIQAWELKRSEVSTGYWNIKANRIKAVRWLINDKLNLSHYEVVNDLSIKEFSANRLSSLIYEYYGESIYKAVREAYGDEFKPWEFGYHRWSKEDAQKATIWLIDKLDREQGKAAINIDYYDFRDNKLRIVIDKYYCSSPKNAVIDALNLIMGVD